MSASDAKSASGAIRRGEMLKMSGRRNQESAPNGAKRRAGAVRVFGAVSVFSLAAVGLGAGAAVAAPAEASISGVVTELDRPVSEVVVSAYRWDAAADAYVFEQETDTAGDGSWTLDFLPDGEYTLDYGTEFSSARFALGESLAGDDDYSDDEPQFAVTGSAASATPFADVDLRLFGGALELTVTAADGTPLIDLDDAAAELRGKTLDGAAVSTAKTFADEEGLVTIPRVPVGNYVAYVGSAGSTPAPVALAASIEAGETVDYGAHAIPAVADGAVAAAGTLAISEAPRVGSAVDVTLPTFDPAGDPVEYRWYADGTLIEDATGATFTPTDDELGTTLTVWVFAHAAGKDPYLESARASAVVVAADDPSATPTPAPTAAPTPGVPSDNAGSASPAPGATPGGGGPGDLAQSGVAPALGVLLAAALVAAGLVLARRYRARAAGADTGADAATDDNER
jgi:hypothetical protein